MAKYFSLSLGLHQAQNSGVRQSVIRKGEHSIRTFARLMIYDVVPLLIRVALSVIILVSINWKLGLVAFVGGAIFTAITLYTNKKCIPELRKIDNVEDHTQKLHTELMRNVELVKINAQETKAQGEHDSALYKLEERSRPFWIRVGNLFYASRMVAGITEVSILAFGGIMVLRGEYTAGYMVMFWSWSSEIFSRLTDVGQLQRNLMILWVSVKKYLEFLEIQSNIVILKNASKPSKFNGKITFENVEFEYPTRPALVPDDEEESSQKDSYRGAHAIKGVSFTLESGKRYAIVGPSGAGKSTLKQLLLRCFDPQKGRILIDGYDLRTLDLAYYLEHIGAVEQDVFLLDRSLKENILWVLDAKTRKIGIDEFDRVCEIASIHKFRHRLEQGYDTIIGEKGVRLSGGERQRVGIARALIKDPAFLIFDEATSHLDAVNEDDIVKELEEASVGRTTIIIAHRLSTILSADEILVMHEGSLVAKGSHPELVKKCSVYQDLVDRQLRSLRRLDNFQQT